MFEPTLTGGRFSLLLLVLIFSGTVCTHKKGREANSLLKEFDHLAVAQVMVVGTYHFAQEDQIDELSKTNQEQLAKIHDALARFKATKVVIEKEAKLSKKYNQAYSDYLNEDLDLSNQTNEVFQLGFKLAAQLGHDSIYLFDNSPPFIGSLENFTFENFEKKARLHDSCFYDRHKQEIIRKWNYNDSLISQQPLYTNIKFRNSPEMQRFNAQRMHLYEVRAGIGHNWMGPDWLGRWYQRNIRMMGHLLRIAEEGDRLLVIVGDNHKWILEQLMWNTPDLRVVSSYDYL